MNHEHPDSIVEIVRSQRRSVNFHPFRFVYPTQVAGMIQAGFIPSPNVSDFHIISMDRVLGFANEQWDPTKPVPPDIEQQLNMKYGQGNWRVAEIEQAEDQTQQAQPAADTSQSGPITEADLAPLRSAAPLVVQIMLQQEIARKLYPDMPPIWH